MSDLDDEISKLLYNGFAEKSHRAYELGLKIFRKFAEELHVEITWPVPVDIIMKFIAFLSLNGYACKSIQLYISSISYWHKINNFEDPTRAYVVQKLIEGHRRLHNRVDSRLAITIDILNNLLKVLPVVTYNSYESVLFQAMFILSFWALLRISEITCDSKKSQPHKILQLIDLKFDSRELHLTVNWSKTDQLGRSTKLCIPIKTDNKKHMSTLTQYVQLRGSDNGPLFRHFDKSFVTRSQFNSVLKKCIAFIGHNERSHSFRIGGGKLPFFN